MDGQTFSASSKAVAVGSSSKRKLPSLDLILMSWETHFNIPVTTVETETDHRDRKQGSMWPRVAEIHTSVAGYWARPAIGAVA